MLSTLGYFRISRTARPSPPPKTSTRRAPGKRRESGMDQRFVIAVLVAGAELEMRVEKQPQVVLPLGQDDALIARVAR